MSNPSNRLEFSQLNDHVLLEICDHASTQRDGLSESPLAQLSSTSRRMRILASKRLFRRVKIQGVPQKILKGLDFVAENPHICQHIRWITIHCKGQWPETRRLSWVALATGFTAAMHAIPNLRHLSVYLPWPKEAKPTTPTGAASEADIPSSPRPTNPLTTLHLPTVTTLIANDRSAFLIPHTPNMHKLALHHGRGISPSTLCTLLSSTPSCPQSPSPSPTTTPIAPFQSLKHLHIQTTRLTPSSLQTLHPSLPNLTALILSAQLSKAALPAIATALAAFTSLTCLGLPAHCWFDNGVYALYSPGSMSAEARVKMRERMDAVRRGRMERSRDEVVRAVVEVCEGLKVVLVERGDYAVVRRRAGVVVDLEWRRGMRDEYFGNEL